MATIAFGLRLAHYAGLHKRISTILPLTKTTRHRNGFSVAHLLQGDSSNKRSYATSTIEYNSFRFVGNCFFNLQFKIATRYMDSTRNVPLVPFVLFSYIYKDDFVVFRTSLMLMCQCLVHP